MSRSCLDRPAARIGAALLGLAALGLACWLAYLDLRMDPALAACIKDRAAKIDDARASGALSADVAQRFLAKVAESCAVQISGEGDSGGPPPR
jgi:hypothetical protein